MTLETSRKILKVVGIIGIIFGVLAILIGLLIFGGGPLMQQNGISFTAEELDMMGFTGIVILVLGLIFVLEGIFSVRAANDFSKIMPAWIFAILGLIFNTVGAVWNNINGADGKTIANAAFSIALSILVLAAANRIKKSVRK